MLIILFTVSELVIFAAYIFPICLSLVYTCIYSIFFSVIEKPVFHDSASITVSPAVTLPPCQRSTHLCTAGPWDVTVSPALSQKVLEILFSMEAKDMLLYGPDIKLPHCIFPWFYFVPVKDRADFDGSSILFP